MKGRGVPPIAWVLFLLLAAATGIVLFGARESQTNPDSTSYGPSGVRAFRTLLERNGFETRTTRSALRPLAPDELAIAFFFPEDIPNVSMDAWMSPNPLVPALREHFRRGGRALLIQVPRNFRTASMGERVDGQPVVSAETGKARNVSVWFDESEYGYWGVTGSDKDFVLYSLNELPFLWLDLVDKGTAVTLSNGLGATNRFLDQKENAALMLEAAIIAGGPTRKAVFLEAAHGNLSNPSLVEVIGPWATGMWWQLNLAFIVLVASLGVRFGLPAVERARQWGGREIADALRDTLHRARASEVAMAAILEDADRAIKKRLKIAIDTPDDVRDRQLPDELAEAMRLAANATKTRAPLSNVLAIARRLDSELAKFLGSGERKPARRRRKS